MMVLRRRTGRSSQPMVPTDSRRLKRLLSTKAAGSGFGLPLAIFPRKQTRKSGCGEGYKIVTTVIEPETKNSCTVWETALGPERMDTKPAESEHKSLVVAFPPEAERACARSVCEICSENNAGGVGDTTMFVCGRCFVRVQKKQQTITGRP